MKFGNEILWNHPTLSKRLQSLFATALTATAVSATPLTPALFGATIFSAALLTTTMTVAEAEVGRGAEIEGTADPRAICRIVLDNLIAKESNTPTIIRQQIEKTISQLPAMVNVFLIEQPDGTSNFDPAYDKKRRALVDNFYQSINNKVRTFDAEKLKRDLQQAEALVREKERLNSDHWGELASRIFTLSSDPSIRRITDIDSWLQTYQQEESRKPQQPTRKQKSEIKERAQKIEALENERKSLLSIASVAEKLKQRDELREQDRKGQLRIKAIESELSVLNSQIWTQRNELMPRDLEVFISMNPFLENESLLDYIGRLSSEARASTLISKIVTNEDLAGLLVAELKVLYPKEFKTIIETVEMQKISIQEAEVHRLTEEVAQLKRTIAQMPTHDHGSEIAALETRLKTDMAAITRDQNDIKGQLRLLKNKVNLKIGFFAFILVEVGIHYLLR